VDGLGLHGVWPTDRDVSTVTPTSLLDERTIGAIVATRPHRPGTPSDPYPCGCHRRRPTHWFLCDYHAGYDDALDLDSFLVRWRDEAIPLLELLDRCYELLPPSAKGQLGGSKAEAVEEFLKRITT
jgi:hypothetical protein